MSTKLTLCKWLLLHFHKAHLLTHSSAATQTQYRRWECVHSCICCCGVFPAVVSAGATDQLRPVRHYMLWGHLCNISLVKLSKLFMCQSAVLGVCWCIQVNEGTERGFCFIGFWGPPTKALSKVSSKHKKKMMPLTGMIDKCPLSTFHISFNNKTRTIY